MLCLFHSFLQILVGQGVRVKPPKDGKFHTETCCVLSLGLSLLDLLVAQSFLLPEISPKEMQIPRDCCLVDWCILILWCHRSALCCAEFPTDRGVPEPFTAIAR